MNNLSSSKVIVVDFDGTVVANKFPEVGQDIGAVPVLRRLVEKGHKLVLLTMRSNNSIDVFYEGHLIAKAGTYLDDAVRWFEENDIPLFGIQGNPSQQSGTPKIHADMYIDDLNLGIPLLMNESISGRPFVNWNAVEYLLEDQGLI